jgi:hypothetical protein
MRSLKDILEGLLAGQSSTLETGDEMGDAINDQFEKLKAIVCNHKEYEKWPRQNSWRLYIGKEIDTLVKLLLFNSPTKIFSQRIECQKYSEPTNTGGWRMVWEWSFTVMPTNSKTDKNITIKVYDANISFTKFLKTYVAPHFKDLDSFKKLIEAKLGDR